MTDVVNIHVDVVVVNLHVETDVVNIQVECRYCSC